MNLEQAKTIVEANKDAMSYVKQSHLEELSPLFEVHIEVITARKDQFHALPGNTYMPKKETMDLFADAAGVSYQDFETCTRKDGDDVYVGKSRGVIMGPDGKPRFGDVCEYEFDVQIRHEEDVLRDLDSKWPKYHVQGKLDERKSRLHHLELKKAARQRANTGARSRATLNLLGMATGLKDLFGKDEPDSATRKFMFSRIVVNAKNEMVLSRMLDAMAGTAASIYGPGSALPPGAAPLLEAPQIRTVTPEKLPDDLDAPPADADIFGDEEDTLDPREPFREVLRGYVDDFGDKFKAADLEKIKAAAEDEDISIEDLRKKVETVHGYLKSHGLLLEEPV
jgi:hypothetical protein